MERESGGCGKQGGEKEVRRDVTELETRGQEGEEETCPDVLPFAPGFSVSLVSKGDKWWKRHCESQSVNCFLTNKNTF